MAKKIYTSQYLGSEIDERLSRIDSYSGTMDELSKRLEEINEEGGVYFYYDENNSLYRMFASKEKYELWATDPEQYENLEKFNFVAPSPYTATLTGLSEETKYIRYGESGENTTLNFRWNIEGKNQTNFNDSVVITYTIDNNGVSSNPVRYPHSLQRVQFDLAPYLKPGTNTVTVTMLGDTTNATTSISFIVEALSLLLESSIKNYETVNHSEDGILIPCTVTGSGNYARNIEFYIDGVLSTTEHVTSSENIYNFNKLIRNPKTAGLHTLLIIGYVTINSIKYYSNLLYYDFNVDGYTTTDDIEIGISLSFDGIYIPYSGSEKIKLTCTLYENFSLDWYLFTTDLWHSNKVVSWTLYGEAEEEIPITIVLTTNNTKNEPLFFAPIVSGNCKLVAKVDGQTVLEYDIYINKSKNNIEESLGYLFKLSARGRSNNEPSNLINKWEYIYENEIGQLTVYSTQFENFLWNNNSGWVDNTLTLSNGAKATIDVHPLSSTMVGNLAAGNTNGLTFEIEFETFNADDVDSPIIWLGDLMRSSILITPNSAYMTNDNGQVRLKTNFKEGERIKLDFILNSSSSVDKNLLFLVNNGILERGVQVEGEKFNSNGEIHIDGSTTGVRIYSIKVYNRALSYNEAFANYVMDSGNIYNILMKNSIYDNEGNISEALCEEKVDTILITGHLGNVIGAEDKRAEAEVTIERISLANPKLSFRLEHGRIRRHGQSTLNYPVPNFKIWSDSPANVAGAGTPVMYNNNGSVIYNGRYSFKEGAIPVKKWVLQANYADSSGVHNGGLLRLITDTWYNALIDNEYKLRTPPLEYTTSTGSFKNNGWKEYWTKKDGTAPNFPYQIRISPDSFPCVVFWRDSEEDSYEFLGLYVFMDDKKSDYLYGERSIYSLKNDPFRLKENAPKKAELDCLWNNEKTMQIEILSVNTPFVNYTTNENWEQVSATSDTTSSRPWMFNWENNFELIYPDPDDIYKVGDKNPLDLNDSSILSNAAKPFSDWIQWLVDTYNDYKRTGTYDKFRRECNLHIDIYKLAAYYIYVLRFGLVDSLQRNAQIKTYDGKIFWYEPWDMDIALGNKNTGGIAFDPPIDRDTLDKDNPGTYWISGKNGIPGSSDFTSCWLWDALEAWESTYDPVSGVPTSVGWIDSIVPAVANSLYNAGLTYANVMKMFDEEYQNHWCERMYNDSGYFKYVTNGGGDLLNYLQGARTSHRHWWTKTSFDYYDAKWVCGNFRDSAITIITNTNSIGLNLRIVPATSTYFAFYNGTTGAIEINSGKVEKGETAVFNMKSVLSTKDPRIIYGALNIQKLDISEICQYLERLNLSGLYDTDSGTKCTELNIGMPWDAMLQGSGKFNTKSVIIQNYDTLTRLENLYLRGYRNVTTFNTMIGKFKALKNFYAAGSGLTMFESCDTGSLFDTLELPDSVQSLTLHSSTWKNLDFYHTVVGESYEEEVEDENGNMVIEVKTRDTYLDPNKLTTIPEALNTVIFDGSTGLSECSRAFVEQWVNELDERNAFEGKTLTITNVNWYKDSSLGRAGITFETLMKIAKIPNLTLKGYIKLDDEGLDLTPAQMTQVMNAFGEQVFSLGSSDLTVDYDRNTIIVSAPSPAIVDENNEIYLEEGNVVQLQASVFSLLDIKRSLQWYLWNDNENTVYDTVRFRNTNVTEYLYAMEPYLNKTGTINNSGCFLCYDSGILIVPETKYDARTILLYVEDITDPELMRTARFTIHITKRTYPTSVQIESTKLPLNLDGDNKYYIIGTDGEYIFYPKFFGEDGNEINFTGKIKGYLWKYTNEYNHISPTDILNEEELTLMFDSLASRLQVETILLAVQFYGGAGILYPREFGTEVNLHVIDDAILLLDRITSNLPLFNAFKNNGIQSASTSYYRTSDLLRLTGSFQLSGDVSEILYFKSKNAKAGGNNILLFLTGISSLNISNYPTLKVLPFNDTNSSPEEDWFANSFERVILLNNPQLTDISYIGKDSSLKELNLYKDFNVTNHEDMDETPNLSSIDSRYSLFSPTLFNKVNTLKLGSPDQVTIKDGSKLNTLFILDISRIDTLEISDIKNGTINTLFDILERRLALKELTPLNCTFVQMLYTDNEVLTTIPTLDQTKHINSFTVKAPTVETEGSWIYYVYEDEGDVVESIDSKLGKVTIKDVLGDDWLLKYVVVRAAYLEDLNETTSNYAEYKILVNGKELLDMYNTMLEEGNAPNDEVTQTLIELGIL